LPARVTNVEVIVQIKLYYQASMKIFLFAIIGLLFWLSLTYHVCRSEDQTGFIDEISCDLKLIMIDQAVEE